MSRYCGIRESAVKRKFARGSTSASGVPPSRQDHVLDEMKRFCS